MPAFFKELLLRCGILLPDDHVPAELLFQSPFRLDGPGGPTISSSSSSSSTPYSTYLITCTDSATKAMRRVERELRQTPHKVKIFLSGLEEFLHDDGMLQYVYMTYLRPRNTSLSSSSP